MTEVLDGSIPGGEPPLDVYERMSLEELKERNRELLWMAQTQLQLAIRRQELKPGELIRAMEVMYKIEVPDPKLVNQIQIKVPALFADSPEAEEALAALRSGEVEVGGNGD